jgi:NADP-dependent 3-hydroxy acid dehydrogenase YdfG
VVVARSGDDLRAVADEVGGAAHVADLSDPEVVDGLVAVIEDAHAPIDVPVDNAGIATVDPVDRRLLYACSTRVRPAREDDRAPVPDRHRPARR